MRNLTIGVSKPDAAPNGVQRELTVCAGTPMQIQSAGASSA
jgi:hypothetical protein